MYVYVFTGWRLHDVCGDAVGTSRFTDIVVPYPYCITIVTIVDSRQLDHGPRMNHAPSGSQYPNMTVEGPTSHNE